MIFGYPPVSIDKVFAREGGNLLKIEDRRAEVDDLDDVVDLGLGVNSLLANYVRRLQVRVEDVPLEQELEDSQTPLHDVHELLDIVPPPGLVVSPDLD